MQRVIFWIVFWVFVQGSVLAEGSCNWPFSDSA